MDETKEEKERRIKEEIEKWKERQFLNNMADFFTDEERKFDKECQDNILRLQEELNNL